MKLIGLDAKVPVGGMSKPSAIDWDGCSALRFVLGVEQVVRGRESSCRYDPLQKLPCDHRGSLCVGV